MSDPEARYHRTVDVLDTLAAAQIKNVTYTIGEDELQFLKLEPSLSHCASITSRDDRLSL